MFVPSWFMFVPNMIISYHYWILSHSTGCNQFRLAELRWESTWDQCTVLWYPKAHRFEAGLRFEKWRSGYGIRSKGFIPSKWNVLSDNGELWCTSTKIHFTALKFANYLGTSSSLLLKMRTISKSKTKNLSSIYHYVLWINISSFKF